MSIDIKFRVWDKTSDSMLYQDDFERVEIDTKNKMVTLIAEEESDKSHYVLDYEDGIEAEIMRYTGLKDKNGKEIYEKDIVKVTINNKTFNAWIVFEMGSFMIANDDITYYIDDNWNDNVKCLSELAWEQEEFEDRIYCLEVIGDTYQNIDLIEV
ncbi:MAG: YopX family protein [Clostridium perfringens]|nr:YopX family protein [Clostridium perfringens]